ncbi:MULTISPECIES: glycosyltransferase [unclassified Mycobacterium]|uniref:glycosyltransferase n=1 Tax=unclassified Mycobacterium TaxID=2642494 RepID=UPI00073FFDCA|nr:MULTISPECIES: glycosyltransferase [unclassified Mycobacterium]KUH80883.1 glycosyl transferase family 1 [Mycobacterium sp. GA-0227b]KUH92324.1 glycosyl transferase family 1 [Mycobacterium sp. GA-1999]
MKFVLGSYGSRGDVEPCVAVGRELQRRGHDVRMVVPPELIRFTESTGLAAVGCGPDLQAILDAHRDFWSSLFRRPWKVRALIRSRRRVGKPIIECWEEMSTTLMSLADGADLIFTGLNFEDAAANVAEFHRIPLATLHYFPLRANGQLLPFLPAPLGRAAMRLFWRLNWLGTKKVENEQRRRLGLPKVTGPSAPRITQRGALEIQAYDEACFPDLPAEWANLSGQRPFVGALTVESPTDADDEVASWIAAGTPPIFFGFGSISVESAAETLAMIGGACAQLGERALISSGGTDFSDAVHFEHVKVVETVNYAAVFPTCRAVVHHGGAGTTAAGLRAGVPTLILSTDLDQSLWGVRVKRLKVGTARRLSTTNQKVLVDDLRIILSEQYVVRAREIASRMTTPAESASAAADLVERHAQAKTC